MGIEPVKRVSKTQAWLGMMRISNAPTIVSNILVGTAIAMQSKYFGWNPSHDVFFALSILVVYFAGMILNDAFDARHDEVYRPSRPIPSGVIRQTTAWIVGVSLLCAVYVFATQIAGPANGLVLLVVAVLFYTFFHRWFIPAIFFMALCRGLVYLLVANPSEDVNNTLLITLCLALAFYTAVLTFIGRFENKKNIRFAWVTWLLLVPPIYIVFATTEASWIASIPLAVMAYWIWLAWNNFKSNNKLDGMHRILSGFCLLDCVLATTLEQYVIAGLCLVCFFLTVGFHRKILGT